MQIQAERPLERRETKRRGQNRESEAEGRAWRPRTVQRSGRRRGKCQGGRGVTESVGSREPGEESVSRREV